MRLSIHGAEGDVKANGAEAIAKLAEALGLDETDLIKAIAGGDAEVRKVLVAKNKGFAHPVLVDIDEQIGDEYEKLVVGIREKIIERLKIDESSDTGSSG